MVHFVCMKLGTYLSTAKVTPAQIASKIGVSEKAVVHWVAGNRTPRPKQMVKIIAATNGAVTANDFLPSQSNEAA